MKRPRFALWLILSAMAALVSIDGLRPVERGVAADFRRHNDPLCPLDCTHETSFQWFDSIDNDQLRPASLDAWSQPEKHVTSLEEDESFLAATIEQAYYLTSLYRTLMDNFALFGMEIVEPGLEPDYNYGAIVLADDAPAAEAPDAVTRDIALGWRGVPALNWMSECDICPNFSVIASQAVLEFSARSKAGDLSSLVEDVRQSQADAGLELNADNEGLFAADEPAADEATTSDQVAEEQVAAADSDFAGDGQYSRFIATIDGGYAYDVISGPKPTIPDKYLGETTPANIERHAEFEQARLRPRAPLESAQFDCWSDRPAQSGCPLLEEEDDSVATAEESADTASTALDSCGWPACEFHPERGDIAWYHHQQEAAGSNSQVEQGPVAEGLEPEQAARLSGELSEAFAGAAALLNGLAERLIEVRDEALAQAERLEDNASQASRPDRGRCGGSSEIIYREL